MNKKILYVRGYSPNKHNSKSTANTLQRYLGEKYTVECIDYDQRDPQAGLVTLEQWCEENEPNLIVSSSLGSFFTLLLPAKYNKVIVNPCMKPNEVLPIIGFGDASVYDPLVERVYNTDYHGAHVAAFFADNDTLLGNQYYAEVQRMLDVDCVIFKGDHRLNEDSIKQLVENIRDCAQ